jgi:hypothetical protein
MALAIERTTTIDAPVDAVAATLADFGALASWASAVDHASSLNEPSDGVGACRRVQMGRRTVVERVVDWDLPTTLAYRIEGLPKPLGEVVNRWTLEASGDRTLARLTSTIDAGPRPVGRLIERIAGRQLGSTSEGLLADLAAHHAPAPPSSSATAPGSPR